MTITVGVTAVGGGVGQAVLRALSYSNLQIRTLGLDMQALSAGLYWADAAFLVPPASQREKYIRSLSDLCSECGVDVLIPGSDPELYPLAAARQQLAECGCQVIVSNPSAIELCRDKWALAAFCQEHGLPFVLTYTLLEAQAQVKTLDYPLIVKPRSGSGSVGVRLVFTPTELLSLPVDKDYIVQPYLPPDDSELPTPELSILTHELTQTNELSLQFFVGSKGEILGSFSSRNRLKNGIPVEVITDVKSSVLEQATELLLALVAQGVRGPINLQGRMTEEGVRFFEVNPRFTGLTGVRASLGYREVDAAIWTFFMDQPAAARSCLPVSTGHNVALRHVEETVIP
ncbi:MAG: ATP-grasp domain-containing protein, partial [Anaerolineae bacterium]